MESHQRLQKARKARGLASASEAAVAFGWNRNTYISNENGNAPFSFNKAKVYARAFGVRPEWLYDGKGAMKAEGPALREIVGYAGADPSGAIVFADGHRTGDFVPTPPNASEEAMPILIRGFSMPFFAEDGSIVWIDRQTREPRPEMFNHVVVCQLDTGEVLIKRLQKGTEDGRFNLASFAGPLRENVKLEWVAEITSIIPPLQARRVIQGAV